jgi:hypothetical protein
MNSIDDVLGEDFTIDINMWFFLLRIGLVEL